MAVNKRDFALFNEISDSAAKQISESRSFFEKMYKTTMAAILLIAAIGLSIFFWFFGQKYSDIEASVSRKTDEQIVALQQQIRKRVEEEFKTENMKALIRSVAQEETKSGLSEVILRAVGDQVQNSIKAQSPKIQETVIQETKKSVSGLAPTIDKAIAIKAKDAENRIQNRIAQWEEISQVGNLAILARNGDGGAYDRLMTLGRTKNNPDIQLIATTTENQLFIEMNQPFYSQRNFIEEKSEQEMLKLIDDPQPLIRKAAIDTLANKGNKSIVPRLLDKAETDPYLVVRHAAFHGLQVLTGEKIEALQLSRWKAWWQKNKDIWPPKSK
jgi:hypothetical protein